MCRVCGCDGHVLGEGQAPSHEHHPHAEHSHGEHSHAEHSHAEHSHAEHSHAEHSHAGALPGVVSRTVTLERDLLAKNDHLATVNRRWLAERKITMLNLIGAPGAGKTALLEATIPRLRDQQQQVFVLEGDQATDLDAQRIQATGCGVLQINTGAGCHLDAAMVAKGLEDLAPPEGSVVFVENVGNLVCPALFDLGECAKIAVMSVTEGEDKPVKYPHIVRAAELLLLTKLDLVPYLDFGLRRCLAYAYSVNPRLEALCVAARAGDGLEAWNRWIGARVALRREVVPA